MRFVELSSVINEKEPCYVNFDNVDVMFCSENSTDKMGSVLYMNGDQGDIGIQVYDSMEEIIVLLKSDMGVK